jgi:hypothetical protein
MHISWVLRKCFKLLRELTIKSKLRNQNNCLLNRFVYVFNCLFMCSIVCLNLFMCPSLHEIGHTKTNYALNQLHVMENVATLGVSRSF